MWLQGRKAQEAAFVPEVEEEDTMDGPMADAAPEQPNQAIQLAAPKQRQQQPQTGAADQGMASAGQEAAAHSSAEAETPVVRGEGAAAAASDEPVAALPELPKQVSTRALLCSSESLKLASLLPCHTGCLSVRQHDIASQHQLLK